MITQRRQDYTRIMFLVRDIILAKAASTPSRRTQRAELLRLCARIGYSPPA